MAMHLGGVCEAPPTGAKFVISMVGADRVMIGSDYCFDMGYEAPVGFVEELNLSSELREMILGATAAKLLKLNVKAAS